MIVRRSSGVFNGNELSRSDRLAGNVARNHFLSRSKDNSGNFALYMPRNEWRRKGQAMISRLISASVAVLCLVGLTLPSSTQESPNGYSLHRKKGGYSYDKSDSVNTYGAPSRRRSAPPGPPDFRDQTIAGPFDNSFFFDSGVGSLYGGNSPYMH